MSAEMRAKIQQDIDIVIHDITRFPVNGTTPTMARALTEHISTLFTELDAVTRERDEALEDRDDWKRRAELLAWRETAHG